MTHPALTPSQDAFVDALQDAIKGAIAQHGDLATVRQIAAALVATACGMAYALDPTVTDEIDLVLAELKRPAEEYDAMVEQGVHPRIADRILREKCPHRRV